jgi:hypothetical protein
MQREYTIFNKLIYRRENFSRKKNSSLNNKRKKFGAKVRRVRILNSLNIVDEKSYLSFSKRLQNLLLFHLI